VVRTRVALRRIALQFAMQQDRVLVVHSLVAYGIV
jgi:hypothetical protein